MPFKVGNLYFEFIAGTYLAVLGYRSADIADYLESAGLIEIRMVDGQLYYKWTKARLSRVDFLKEILPPSER